MLIEKITITRDVIVCRGIWYVATLFSIVGLCISLNLLWPSGGFLRDGAVSVTTFYAVMLIRYLFFTDPPPSPCYKEFTTRKEKIPQAMFSCLALCAVILSPLIFKSLIKVFVYWVSIFTISLFTGGLGLIQLSNKLRMEIKHALLTLSYGWLFCLFGILMSLYGGQDNPYVDFILGLIYLLLTADLVFSNVTYQESPLPAL